MKTNHYPNKITSHMVTIVPMTLFTLKSTSKLRFFLHFRYSIVISRFIPPLIRLNFNNHYDNGFHNTFDYNHSIYRDYLLYTVTDSALMGICDTIVTMKSRGLYNI